MKKNILVVLCLVSMALSLFAAGSQEDKGDNILRIGSSSNGPEMTAIFDSVTAEFEASHPGISVKWDRSSGDDYQFTGLPSLLQSTNPPDIYFEWGGNRVRNHFIDGEALDISDLAAELAPTMNESAWNGAVYDGKTYMIPMGHDVTIQMWYDKDVFNELGLTVPRTWSEFISVCDTIVAAGKTPIVMGNSDAWVTGNFIGLFLYMMAGDEKAEEILGLEKGTTLDDPDFVKALQIAYDMAKKGYFNSDMNTLGYEESFSRMFDGSSVMYPLGSWYPDEVVGLMGFDFEEVNHDYFMLPQLPGGKGSSNPVLGLNTGYMINSETKNKELAYDYMRILMSLDTQKKFTELGGLSTVTAANAGGTDYLRKLAATMDDATSVVAPPDTGYELEMAFALYEAIAKVSQGVATPEEALGDAESKIKHLR